MPKSGHMANQHGKVCAAAVVALLSGQEVNPAPIIANTCYSYIDDKEVVHIASVHSYDSEKKTRPGVPAAGAWRPPPAPQKVAMAEGGAAIPWRNSLTGPCRATGDHWGP